MAAELKKKILVVDDEEDIVNFLSEELEYQGYRTDRARDGVEAVLKVLDGGIDAVLMDIRMPRLDGVNALRIIRKAAPAVPVIMFTGQAGQGDMAASTQYGAFTCLLKPVAPDRLMQVLQTVLDRRV